MASLSWSRARSAARAVKAIAEGRVPGQVGQPRILSDEERVLGRRATYRKYREANIEAVRSMQAAAKKQERADRAIADGREPGRIGRIVIYTEEERIVRTRASSIAYWARNPEKRVQCASAYYEANKDKVFANVTARRVKKAGNGGTFTAKDIAKIHDDQAGLCLFCMDHLGEKTPHIDHWKPVSKGGSNDPSNLALLHGECNRRKGAKMPSEFGLPSDPRVLRAAIQDGLRSLVLLEG